MKSFITASLLIGTIVIAKAQNNHNNNYYYDNNNYSNSYNTGNNSYYSNTSYNSSNNSYGYSSYSNSNGWANNYDYSYWTIRKITKNYLFETGMFLNNVLYQFAPNPFTGPLLSGAVRHQRFAKTLYYQGFYDEALQHSNYARSLTMKAANFLNPYFMPAFTDFSFLNNGGYNNNGGNGYGAYDDNYRKANPNSSNNTGDANRNANSESKKAAPLNNSKGVKQIMKKEISSAEIQSLEKSLPKDNLQEKELLKTKGKDLTIE